MIDRHNLGQSAAISPKPRCIVLPILVATLKSKLPAKDCTFVGCLIDINH